MRFAILTIALTLPTAMFAQDRNVVLGFGASYGPKFEGSDRYETKGVPFISFDLGRFSIGPDKIAYRIFEGEDVLSVSLGYGGKRDADDLSRDGLADIGNAGRLGLGYSHSFGPARAYVDLNRYLGASEGTSLVIGGLVRHPISERVTLSADLSATYSDSNYMHTYFAIDSAGAAASGYPVHEAGAGFRRADLRLGTTYTASEAWSITGVLGLGTLLGDTRNSPLVEDRSPVSATAFVTYRF